MKRLSIIFLLVALLVASACLAPMAFAASSGEIVSGYYGVNASDALIGQIAPGTSVETLYSRVLVNGSLSVTKGVVTGSNLVLTRDGKTVDTLTLVVQADCSGDGAFSVTDMLMIKSLLLSQQKFSAAQTQAGDVSGDGKVTITDFLQMKSKLLKLGDFTIHTIAGSQKLNSILLTPGETYAFGPAGIALMSVEEEPPAESQPKETQPQETEPQETEPQETEPQETEPQETEPPVTDPPEPPVKVQGDAVIWENGVITAVKPGTAKLTWENQTLVVTVCKDPLSISFPSTSLLLDPQQTYSLQPILNHPVSSDIQYASSNAACVKVDGSGKLTALKEGTATVTATLPNGKSAKVDIRVLPMIKSLSFPDPSIKLKNGTTKTLSVTKAPANSTEKLVWTSSDNSIATVDENGVVRGIKNGTVTITCTSQYGKVSASCKVKVCNLIQVALTFDDGPSSAYTGKVLDMLKKYDAKATFFLVGNRITSKTAPFVKRMADEGHEIGYHTMSHRYLFNMSTKEMTADLQRFQAIVKSATGGKVATVYRAPGGGITDDALKTLPIPHILWSIDTRDWETRNTAKVRDAVLRGLKDGAIILVHDIHGTTYTGVLEAFKVIASKDMDVEFLTVTELLSRKGTPPENGVTYRSGR